VVFAKNSLTWCLLGVEPVGLFDIAVNPISRPPRAAALMMMVTLECVFGLCYWPYLKVT